MAVEIKVPAFAESITEGTVGKWLKKVGDQLKVGEVVVELETDKVNFDVTVTDSGYLESIAMQPGENVTVGDVLGTIKTDGAPAAKKPAAKPAKAEPEIEQTARPMAAAPKPRPEATEKVATPQDDVDATPIAYNLAEANGISLETLVGTGIGGKITKTDVELAIAEKRLADRGNGSSAAAETRPVRTGQIADEVVPLSRRRVTISRKMLQVQQSTAMTTTYNEVDMTEVVKIRRRYKEHFLRKYDVNLGFMSFFVKAVVVALKDFKILNAELTKNDELIYKNSYNIGVAIASQAGLVVPVVNDADVKSFAEIERDIKDYVVKTKAETLELKDLLGGTFTITNGGVFGSLLSTPMLNYPQVGILGMHTIKERPVAIDGKVEIRPMMYLAVTYDHRIVDGADAVQFLVAIKKYIESPNLLMVDL